MNRKCSNGNDVHIFVFSIIMASDKRKQNVPKLKEDHAYHLYTYKVVKKKKYINSTHRTVTDTGQTYYTYMHV